MSLDAKNIFKKLIENYISEEKHSIKLQEVDSGKKIDQKGLETLNWWLDYKRIFIDFEEI